MNPEAHDDLAAKAQALTDLLGLDRKPSAAEVLRSAPVAIVREIEAQQKLLVAPSDNDFHKAHRQRKFDI